MVKVNGSSLSGAQHVAVVLAGAVLHVVASIGSRDARPLCPACHERIEPEDEAYLCPGMTFCRDCLSLRR